MTKRSTENTAKQHKNASQRLEPMWQRKRDFFEGKKDNKGKNGRKRMRKSRGYQTNIKKLFQKVKKKMCLEK